MASYGFKDSAIISACNILGFSRTIKGSEDWETALAWLEQFRGFCPNCEMPIHIDHVDGRFKDVNGADFPERVYNLLQR